MPPKNANVIYEDESGRQFVTDLDDEDEMRDMDEDDVSEEDD